MSRDVDPVRIGAGLALVVVLAQCSGTGATPTRSTGAAPTGPASAAIPAASSQGTPTAPAASSAPPVSAQPSPTSAALPAGPPAATLEGAGVASAAGMLGSYTWLGTGSDAPWVVGRSTTPVVGGAPLVVAVDPAPAAWTAAWARVADGSAGTPTGATSGTGQVALSAPRAPGDWSLRVTATFGPGANATYFWHLAVR